MPVTVDPRMRFDSFVVGAGNRLAWEAARTTAESPGAAYNPLFIYSDTGLGKTHLLAAIANRAHELESGIRVVYTPVEELLEELKRGEPAETRYREAEILLIDDLQFLGVRREHHQALFHILDQLLLAGRQVVLASDQPPLEMGELDDRLVSRFSGGLVVDIDRPNFETRRSIVKQRLNELGEDLGDDVIDAIAQVALENVRQLRGALHRVLAVARAEQRTIGPHEVDRILSDVVTDRDLPWLGDEVAATEADEFEEFVSDVSLAVEEAVTSPRWREQLARAILRWEAEGFKTSRLERYIDSDEPIDAREVIEAFERDIAALRSAELELERLDTEATQGLPLRDPDRVKEVREVLEGLRREHSSIDEFFLDAEKVIWDWPVIEDRLIEEWGDGHQG